MEELRQYLANHHGVITLAQARHFGLSDGQVRYRVDAGRLVRVAPRVFRLATAPNTWPAQARAMALSARGLIGCTAALRIWNVDGHIHRSTFHVLVDGQRRPRTPGAIVHRVESLGEADGRLVNGIPVTGPVRSIIDSAALLGTNQLDATIDAAVRQRLVTIAEVGAELDRIGTAGRKGAGRLRRLIADRNPTDRVPDSMFNRLVGQLLVDAGLPTPTYEFEVHSSDRLIGRADLAYPHARLLIECDSARWHRNRKSFVADPRRKNRLLIAGYNVLTFTWDDYADRPADLVALVRQAFVQGLDSIR